MAVTRLKLLNRQKIAQRDIKIALETTGKTKRFTADLNLQEYHLPPNARIFVDARQLMETIRFDLGTVGKPSARVARDISRLHGERVTFGVNNDQTPYYFKDRDKTIRTPTGQAKKIVHYVKEHERKYGDKITMVKEHIRGLQEFEWAGYQCNVISPKLQAKTAANFTLPSEDVEVDEDTSNVVYLSKVGKALADSEERRSA